KKNLLKKGQTNLVSPDPKINTSSTIAMARLQYDGNWDPEPGGWRRMAAILHNTQKIDLKIEPVKLGADKLKGQKIAHLTGTSELKLDDAARKELKDYVTGGGTLIIDSAGGSSAFAQSVESELETIFGDDAKSLAEPVPQDSPVYTAGKMP